MTPERRPTIVDLPTPRFVITTEARPENVGNHNVQMMLIGMQGEGGFSGHDPIGLGVIAKRVKTDHGDRVQIDQYDTQPELAKTGKIDTDALAERMHNFATAPGDAKRMVAVGLTIYSVNYWRATMIKYNQLCEEQPPAENIDFVMGGAIPTHTDSAILKAMFPNFKLVKGEGEERMSTMVGQASKGEELTESKTHEYADLQNYQGADRELTYGILHAGGMPKTESSRGCGFGNCSFCSREVMMGRGGRDFRVIPAETVVEEVKTINGLLREFSGNRFEFADEDAFSDIGSTRLLVSALKTAQTEGELPRIPFGASLRVDSLIALAEDKSWDQDLEREVSLLEQLREVGLDKVFLGVEGGSNKFLHDVAKGQTTEKIMEGIARVKESIYTDPTTGEQKALALEMGYITFAYKLDTQMLRENVQFLSMVEDDPTTESTDVSIIHARHVSSLFNNLEVRAGTNDAINIRRDIKKANDTTHRDYEKYRYLRDYDLDANFNLNSSVYENVPFLDPEVKRVYDQVVGFAQADESLYYAVKSAVRTDGIEDEARAMIENYYLQMKGLHLRFLRNEVGLPDLDEYIQRELQSDGEQSNKEIAAKRHDIISSRRHLIASMHDSLKTNNSPALESVRRELDIFISQEDERLRAGIETEKITSQRGALAVIRDDKQRVLVVRATGQDVWTFPGGNINGKESKEEALTREITEEGGVERKKINVGRELRRVDQIEHVDATTGARPKLLLSHFEVTLSEGEKFDHMKGDHEIADTLWLSPEDLIAGTVEVSANVASIAQDIIDERGRTSKSEAVPGGEIIFH